MGIGIMESSFHILQVFNGTRPSPGGMERIICKRDCFSTSGMIGLGGRSMASAYRFQSISSCLGYEAYSGDVATLLTTVEAEAAEEKWEVITVENKLRSHSI